MTRNSRTGSQENIGGVSGFGGYRFEVIENDGIYNQAAPQVVENAPKGPWFGYSWQHHW